MKKFNNFIIGFRVTTSNLYGKGHIVRCKELAKAFKYKVIFFTDPNYKPKMNLQSGSSTLN